ncbi:MAG: hypothetical protein H7X80_11290 [bacterium]|nr:hypothetical protein [Candidatus Kapabacteria bacterium]
MITLAHFATSNRGGTWTPFGRTPLKSLNSGRRVVWFDSLRYFLASSLTYETMDGGRSYRSVESNANTSSYYRAVATRDARNIYIVGGGNFGRKVRLATRTTAAPQSDVIPSLLPHLSSEPDGDLALSINAINASSVRVSAIASNGRIARTWDAVDIEPGQRMVVLDIADLSSGVYMLDVIVGDQRYSLIGLKVTR